MFYWFLVYFYLLHKLSLFENYFYDIVKELDKKDKNIINDIKIKLSNQELFFEDIKIYLEQSIYNFNKYEENEIDF